MEREFGPSYWTGEHDRILLAPMEGVVDAMMRDVLTQIGGIDLCVTEFIRVTDRLLPASEFFKDCPELRTGDATRTGVPVLVQLLGGQPGPLGENAALACELGARGIDLNFGCPAKTVNRHDGGATLLKDPSRVFDVVSSVRRATPAHLTVSAKVRLGFSDKNLHVEIAKAAEEGGASWLTVHARTRDEGYRPPAHWEFIARMREAVSGSADAASGSTSAARAPMTVIANGDIWTADDAAKARAISGCRHIMIGRGLLSDPFLARELKGGAPGTWPEAFTWFENYVLRSVDERGDHFGSARAKQWLKSLGRRYTEAREVFEVVKRYSQSAEILAGVRASCEPGWVSPAAAVATADAAGAAGTSVLTASDATSS